ncbi:hypothetical protein HNR00_000326 [Methylorubrum rhodinum]|uniref:Uncharacterized protein n=1 Tax=Methylorubrum rhodinum TaxID=29428 RepID=A0A840ZF59_9HYPH|nr:hypothetical protein [Methylorubrum rhodinum]MBB5755637.1 hypothetical protein [Methylorubrum rhodinum]
MSAPAAWTVAAAPLAVALLALVATYATGFDQRAAMPPDVANRFYGFFLDRYPLFAFVLVYGLARILVAALAPGRAGVIRRLIGGLLGLALVAGASLHPTFGGLILRAGFGTGSGAFLNGMPMAIAYALGAAAGASVFGLAMGLGVLLAGRPGHPAPGGRWRALGRGLVGMVGAFLALWFGAALIGAGRDLGLGPWPRRPLDGGDLAIAAGLITAAALPHVLLIGSRLRPRRIGVTG